MTQWDGRVGEGYLWSGGSVIYLQLKIGLASNSGTSRRRQQALMARITTRRLLGGVYRDMTGLELVIIFLLATPVFWVWLYTVMQLLSVDRRSTSPSFPSAFPVKQNSKAHCLGDFSLILPWCLLGCFPLELVENSVFQ